MDFTHHHLLCRLSNGLRVSTGPVAPKTHPDGLTEILIHSSRRAHLQLIDHDGQLAERLVHAWEGLDRTDAQPMTSVEKWLYLALGRGVLAASEPLLIGPMSWQWLDIARKNVTWRWVKLRGWRGNSRYVLMTRSHAIQSLALGRSSNERYNWVSMSREDAQQFIQSMPRENAASGPLHS